MLAVNCSVCYAACTEETATAVHAMLPNEDRIFDGYLCARCTPTRGELLELLAARAGVPLDLARRAMELTQ